MPISESILTGRKYRVWDAANSIWKRLSFWTKASDVEMNDGSTVESTIGNIIGNLTASDDLVFKFTKSGSQYGYLNASGTFVPFKNPTGTKSITANGNGIDVTDYASVDVSVPNTNSETYTPTSRSASLDMGVNNSYRYVNTNSVPNSNWGTYGIGSNGTFDMGETNIYRYVSVNVPLNPYGIAIIYQKNGGQPTGYIGTPSSLTANVTCQAIPTYGSLSGGSFKIGWNTSNQFYITALVAGTYVYSGGGGISKTNFSANQNIVVTSLTSSNNNSIMWAIRIS